MLRFTTLTAIAITAAQPALAAPHMEYGTGDGERFAYTTELRGSGSSRKRSGSAVPKFRLFPARPVAISVCRSHLTFVKLAAA
jgi:hypothetical protein